MSKSLRRELVALSTAACLGLAGCYGQFALTRKLYNWNGNATSNKFVNSAILWALIIVPVYELASLGDFLIFNTIEFYTGSNPVAMNQDGSVDTRYADHDYHLQRLADGRVEVAIDGKPSYRYREAGENLVLEDLNGKIMRVVPAREHMNAARAASGTL
jgi:Domain of unknown function (DUF3332)